MPGLGDSDTVDDEEELNTVDNIFREFEARFGIVDAVGDERATSLEHAIAIVNRLYPIDMQAPRRGPEETSNPASYGIPELEAHLTAAAASSSSTLAATGPDAGPRLPPVDDSLFEARKRNFDMFIQARSSIQTELQRLQGLDENTRPVVSDSINRRFQRLVEIMYYAENVQQGVRHLMSIANGSIAPGSIEGPTQYFCKRFKVDDTKLNSNQTLIKILLATFELRNYRRYQSDVYEPILTAAGVYTHAWRYVCSIKEMVWRECASDRDPETRNHATSTNRTIPFVIEYLENCEEAAFRPLRKNRRIFAFRNALYVTAVDRASPSESWHSYLVLHEDAKNDPVIRSITADGSVAVVYHDVDCPLPPHGERRWSADAGILPPTPVLDRIITHQRWDFETNITLKRFIGRMLHPIGGPKKLDNFQVYVDMCGTAQTGKSTIISDVVAKFFDKVDVAYLSNSPQKAFAFECCIGKLILCVPEVKADMAESIDQAQFQQAVSGENVSVNCKFKQVYQFMPFTLPIIMAGNEGIAFKDNAESWSRRRVQFFFGVPVTDVDPFLPAKLYAELPAIIIACNELYLQLASMCKGKVWDYLPQSFTDARTATAEQSHALTHFLAHGQLEFGPAERGYYVHSTVFTRLFKQHAKENDMMPQTLSRDYYYAAFFKKNITHDSKTPRPDPTALAADVEAAERAAAAANTVVSAATLEALAAALPARKGPWILGVRPGSGA